MIYRLDSGDSEHDRVGQQWVVIYGNEISSSRMKKGWIRKVVITSSMEKGWLHNVVFMSSMKKGWLHKAVITYSMKKG